MRKIHSFFKPFPVHTVLIGIFPCLALFATNISQIDGFGIIRSLIFSILFAFISYIVARLLIKDTVNAAFFASLFLVFFYSYGHLYTLLNVIQINGAALAHHSYLVIVWAVILLFGFLLAYKRKIHLSFHNGINIASLLLVLFQVILISRFYIQINTISNKATKTNINVENSATQTEPDVYYILLDSYADEQILQEKYGFDNSAFLNSLKELGFYIPENAKSNYYTTIFSMLSTFNMNYHDEIGFPVNLNSSDVDYNQLIPYFKHNPVRSEFEKRGYQIISFETGYYWLNWNDTDIYYEQAKSLNSSQEFEHLFARTTFLRMLEDTGIAEKSGLDKILPVFRTSFIPDNTITDHDGIPGAKKRYDRLLFTFDWLEKTVEIPGNKFVYAHILSPHEPFVFDEQGNFHPTDKKQAGYTSQVQFLNQRILEIVTHILENSPTPPIIIIQGDHNSLKETDPKKTQVLSALYMPGEAGEHLYGGITPVNHFRYIFSNYFGMDIPLIADKSFIKGASPYDFIPVTDSPNN